MGDQHEEDKPSASGFGSLLVTEWARFKTLRWRDRGRHPLFIVVALALFILLAHAAIGFVILVLPRRGSIPFWSVQDYVQPETAVDRAALVTAEVYATLAFVEIIGSLVLLITVMVAFYTANQTRKQIQIAQDGQITDRFAKAIEMLGSTHEDGRPRMEVRLGGIFALERLAQDSCRENRNSPNWCRDHWPIMEVLTSCVRSSSMSLVAETISSYSDLKLKPDIESIVKVLRQRNKVQIDWEKQNGHRLDLSDSKLHTAYLAGTHLEGAHLQGAHLDAALLLETRLSRANLRRAYLRFAFLTGADLEGADLYEAHLEGANLGKVTGLRQEQIDESYMDERTNLHNGLGVDGIPLRRSTANPNRIQNELSGRKTYSYVTHKNRLLVLQKVQHLGDHINIPGGTLHPFEEQTVGALRIAIENIGCEGLEIIRYLGDQWIEASNTNEWHHRFFYHLKYSGDPPETWDCNGLSFYWWPLEHGIPDLAHELGARLPELLESLKANSFEPNSSR